MQPFSWFLFYQSKPLLGMNILQCYSTNHSCKASETSTKDVQLNSSSTSFFNVYERRSIKFIFNVYERRLKRPKRRSIQFDSIHSSTSEETFDNYHSSCRYNGTVVRVTAAIIQLASERRLQVIEDR